MPAGGSTTTEPSEAAAFIVEEGADLADNFIVIKFNEGVHPMKGNRGETIPIKGDFESGRTFTIKFTAKKI